MCDRWIGPSEGQGRVQGPAAWCRLVATRVYASVGGGRTHSDRSLHPPHPLRNTSWRCESWEAPGFWGSFFKNCSIWGLLPSCGARASHRGGSSGGAQARAGGLQWLQHTGSTAAARRLSSCGVGAFQMAQWYRLRLSKQEVQETQFPPLGREDPLEKDMATHSSTLA